MFGVGEAVSSNLFDGTVGLTRDELPLLAYLTEAQYVGGVWLYGWSEAYQDPGSGAMAVLYGGRLGLLSPAPFMPAMERNNRIVQLPCFVSLQPGWTWQGQACFTFGAGDAGGGETIYKDGVLIASEPGINFVEGSGVTITAVDNPGSGRVDVTIDATGGGGGISGSGTTGTMPVFTGTTSIGDSQTIDDGINIVSGDGSQATNYTLVAAAGQGYVNVTNSSGGILLAAPDLIDANMVGVYADTTLFPLIRQDYTNGTTYIGSSNLPNIFPATTTSAASINLPPGTAPSSPTNGDFWTTSTSAYARINGVTKDLASGGSGTVTTVSVTTANGVSGSVSNPTTTPAITLTVQDASGSQSGLINTSAQTFAGVKTFAVGVVVTTGGIVVSAGGMNINGTATFNGLISATANIQLLDPSTVQFGSSGTQLSTIGQSSDLFKVHGGYSSGLFVGFDIDATNLRVILTTNSGAFGSQSKFSIYSSADASIVDGGTATTGGLKFVGGVYISGSSTGLKANTGTPSIAANSAAGTGATASISGDDNSGQITLNTGSVVGLGAGSLLTVTYGTAFSGTRYPTFSPANANAASAGLLSYVSSPGSTTFDISATAALTASVTYLWNYKVIGD